MTCAQGNVQDICARPPPEGCGDPPKPPRNFAFEIAVNTRSGAVEIIDLGLLPAIVDGHHQSGLQHGGQKKGAKEILQGTIENIVDRVGSITSTRVFREGDGLQKKIPVGPMGGMMPKFAIP